MTGTTDKTTKGYLRISAGPLRFKYVHRVVAAALIGRELTKDEEVHHKDSNRKNPNFDNLFVLGKFDHSFISTTTQSMVAFDDINGLLELNEFLEGFYIQQANFIRDAHANQSRFESLRDGSIKAAWDEKQIPKELHANAS